MSIRDIVIYLDQQTDLEADLKAAMRIAEEHEAHLTGLHVTVPFVPFPDAAYAGFPAEMISMAEAREEEASKAVRATFEAATKDARVSVAFREDESAAAFVSDTIAWHARRSDLMIVGQTDQDKDRVGGRRVVDEVILSAGRPVLVMPYAGAKSSFGKNVIIGWDGSREASRALSDALPLIAKDAHVHVLVVDPERRPDVHGDIPGSDISRHLAHHGLKVTLMTEHTAGLDPANLILSRAVDLNADMLVMGAFAHSRIQQAIFGGVTRSILDQMTLPVLFSH